MFQYAFMRNALLAIVLLTPLLSLLGTMAVNRKMAFFSDALGHSALAGVGLGVLFGVGNETVSLLVFGVFWALLISRINQSGRTGADTVISVFSSTGIALGLLILSRSGNFTKYSALLVGDVLAIRPADLWYLGAALLAGVVLWGLTYNRLLLTAVSPPLAGSRGVTGPRSMARTVSALSAPVAIIRMRFACMMVPMPMVTALSGTSSGLSKKRALAWRVMSVSSTMWVSRLKVSSGSLKPMWPSWPMPSSCRSTPPAARICAS